MSQLFRSFRINKLFGYKTVNIVFDSDCMILVGENGSGKTTILNCINYVLKQRFLDLAEIPFESIEIVWGKNGKKWIIHQYEVKAKRMGALSVRERTFINRLQDKLQIRDIPKLVDLAINRHDEAYCIAKAVELVSSKVSAISKDPKFVLECVRKLGEDVVAYNFEQQVSEMQVYLTGKVLPLPTYRRIEKYLDPEAKGKNELLDMHFGMSDVKGLIDDIRSAIDIQNKEGYNELAANLLAKFIKEEPEAVQVDIPQDRVEIVLKRLGNKLPADLKQNIITYIEGGNHNSIFVDAMIMELYKIYKRQEHLDNCIKSFVNRCNVYMQNKQFNYDESAVTVKLFSVESGDEIKDLEQLSSGEKQIISMLAYLYLKHSEEDLIVLIDEPELSLSIKWQEHLLPDFINSGKCRFLMAVTHSPFIFNNELREHAKGLHEFIVYGE